MIRGTGPGDAVHSVFGFRNQTSPTIFGHAGLNSINGVGVPDRDLAFVFTTTDSTAEAKTYELRNAVTDRIIEAIG